MGRPAVREGDVVPLFVRVRGIYRQQSIATVRIATPGSEGGPGFEQRVVLIDSLGEPVVDLAAIGANIVVPLKSW